MCGLKRPQYCFFTSWCFYWYSTCRILSVMLCEAGAPVTQTMTFSQTSSIISLLRFHWQDWTCTWTQINLIYLKLSNPLWYTELFGQLNGWYSMFLNNNNLCIHWTLCTSPHSLICISVKNVITKICVQTFTLHTGYINFCMFAITQSDLYSLWALGKCGPVRFIACRSTWSFRVRLKDCSLLHIFICMSRSAWCSEIMIFFYN